jgi:hypothetical protein
MLGMRPICPLAVVLLMSFVGCTSSSSNNPPVLDAGAPPTRDAAPGPGLDASGSTGDGSVVVDAGPDTAPPCTIPIDATVEATIRFTADNERLVYVNGAVVEDDPSLGWPTVSALTVALHRNPRVANVIAMRGRNTSSQGGADRGILVELSALAGDAGASDAGADDAGSAVLLVSDTQWRVSGSAVDAGLGWTEIAYDDSAWSAATDQGPNGMAPWGAVLGPSTAPRWLWSYDSATAATKPDQEDALFRRTFYLSADGKVLGAPGACP